MKKVLSLLSAVCLSTLLVAGLTGCGGKTEDVNNDPTRKEKKDPYRKEPLRIEASFTSDYPLDVTTYANGSEKSDLSNQLLINGKPAETFGHIQSSDFENIKAHKAIVEYKFPAQQITFFYHFGLLWDFHSNKREQYRFMLSIILSFMLEIS